MKRITSSTRLVKPAKFDNKITKKNYDAFYAESINDDELFWSQEAKRVSWQTPFTNVKDVSYAKNDLHINWFADGELNVCVNCVDRHLEENADKTAIIWQGDEPDKNQYISYQDLYHEVCRLANAMEEMGVVKGDRVIIYMPMVPQAAYAMLACARIGAIHSVVFGGFSAKAVADRIIDCNAKVIITADEGIRGGKTIPLKSWVDEALEYAGTISVETVIVTQCTGGNINWHNERDVWYHELTDKQADTHDAVIVNAEDPLFILYTSGSTGKPKGLQHSSGGYLVYAATTFAYTFDYKDDDIYWCTADVGWITGHSYIIYGPLANGATTLMFEGVPTYPSLGRFGEVIDQHKVSIFYTAPTAIRILMADEQASMTSSKRDTLRIIGSVGEPINPEVWRWYHDTFGKQQCPVVDTWWQTETGGFMITPLPYATSLKAGSASLPFFGIKPALVDANSQQIEGEGSGHLVITGSWPGQSRTIWNNHARFIETYFTTHEGMYFTGDGAKRDVDDYYWITGRVDDVLNVSGHRLGTAEIESAAILHDAVVEAAVVGYPHDIKGEGIYIYIITRSGVTPDDALMQEVKQCIRKELGPIATPDLIQWTLGLPKTRSGKIMRRILRKIAANDYENLGDTSTLADPNVVSTLVDGRLNC